MAIVKDNFEMVKSIIKYAKQHNFILELNEKDINGNYPFLMAIVKNNCKMVCLIMEYANENNIKLEFTEADIKNEILSHYSNVYQDLSLIDEDIIYTLYLYRNNDNINIIYSNNSELLKYFERISALRNSTSYRPYNNNVNMNIDNGNCNFLLHKTILDNNPTMVKLIMYNANKKNLLLDINLIDVLGDYPLLWAIK